MSLLCSQVREKNLTQIKSEQLHFLVFQLSGRHNTKIKSCGKKRVQRDIAPERLESFTHQCFQKTCEKYCETHACLCCSSKMNVKDLWLPKWLSYVVCLDIIRKLHKMLLLPATYAAHTQKKDQICSYQIFQA